MKKCSYCGKEYSDDAMKCAVDSEPLSPIGPPAHSSHSEELVSSAIVPAENTIHATARKEMLIGALWCGGGILVTVLTYSAASGGGSYVVAWGAILYGAFRFFRGIAANGNSPTSPTTTKPPVPAVQPTPGKPWFCSTCGQESEAQFTSCWKCQTPRNKTTS